MLTLIRHRCGLMPDREHESPTTATDLADRGRAAPAAARGPATARCLATTSILATYSVSNAHKLICGVEEGGGGVGMGQPGHRSHSKDCAAAATTSARRTGAVRWRW